MVCLFVVGLGVLIRGIVGAGRPSAGQAEPQFDPPVSAVQALLAAGRVWLDGVGNSDVAAWRRRAWSAAWRHCGIGVYRLALLRKGWPSQSTAPGEPGKRATQSG